MKPLIPSADVTVYGALDPEGEVFRKCRLGILGKPANAVLYSRLIGERRWQQVDKLTGASVVEHPDGSITIEGTSQELVSVVKVPVDQARVRWEVVPVGCKNCH
jgi:hypothetical protein